MRVKKVMLVFLIIIWMGIIFVFSNQTANISESKSDSVSNFIIDVTSGIRKEKISSSRREELIKNMRFYVRKTAHFTIYLILSILVYFTCTTYKVKHCFLYTILLCFLYACSDELHQLFILGRTARILDIIIDMFGAFMGCLISKNIFKSK
jgi:VanZ family protein